MFNLSAVFANFQRKHLAFPLLILLSYFLLRNLCSVPNKWFINTTIMDIFGPNLVRCERTIPIVSSTSTTTSLTILSNPSPNYSPSSSSTSYNPIYYDTFDNAVLLLTRPLRALEEACSSSKTRPIDFVLLPPELDVNGELDEVS